MPTTQGEYGIDYQVRAQVTETWAIDAVESSNVLVCDWADRGEFVDDMVGWATWDGVSATFNRRLPEPHPKWEAVYCVCCRLQGGEGVPDTGDDEPLVFSLRNASGALSTTTGYAVYDVTWRALDYEVLPDEDVFSELQRYVSRDIKFAVDSLTLPGQVLRWASTGEDADSPYATTDKTIPEPLPKVFPTAQLRYTWHMVPGRVVGSTAVFPFENILAGLGKVNSANWDAGHGPVDGGVTGPYYPAGTLLFNNVEVRRTRGAAAQPLFTVMFDFAYRPNLIGSTYKGWNSLYHRDPVGKFLSVHNKTSGRPAIYDTYDFDKLFSFV